MRALIIAVFVALLAAIPVSAQTELSIYGSTSLVPGSRIHGTEPGGIGAFDFQSGWESMPAKASDYGVRLTWWQNQNWGWGLDFSHGEFVADGQTLSTNGLSAMGFSEGLNVLTINRYRQWNDLNGALVPYVGAGVGVSLPAFEYDSGAGKTFDIQLGGPAVSMVAGARYPLNDRWSVFGEYKGTYSVNNLDLVGGGNLNTDIITNSVNFGATFGF